jgi:hypothetical protein
MNNQYTPQKCSDEQIKAAVQRLLEISNHDSAPQQKMVNYFNDSAPQQMVNYFNDLIPSTPSDVEETPRANNRRSHNLCPTNPPRSMLFPKRRPTIRRTIPETKTGLATNLNPESRVQFYKLQELKLSEGQQRRSLPKYPCKPFPCYIDHEE